MQNWPAALVPVEPARLVRLVLQHKVDLAAGLDPLADAPRQLLDEMRLAVVLERVDGVETQAVHVEFVHPVKGVVDEEVPHHVAPLRVREVDRGAPRGVDVRVEELLGVGVEVIPRRPEMVVDRVDEDHEPEPMGPVDETLQVLGRAVGRIRSEGQNPVVTPVPLSGEFRQRQQLDRRDAEIAQLLELLLETRIGALRGRRPDMHLVEHRLFPGAALPAVVLPGIGPRVDDHAFPVNVVGLKARGRIGDEKVAVDAEAVAAAGPSRPYGPVPAVLRVERVLGAVEHQSHLFGGRSPEGEAHAVVKNLRPEGHAVRTPHPPAPSAVPC
jgi:hypothetical protein